MDKQLVREHYHFSRQFQRRLASHALQEAPFLLETVVKPEFFEDPYIGVIIEKAVSYLQEHQMSGTLDILKDMLSQEVPLEEWPIFEKVFTRLHQPVSLADKTYVVSAAKDFARAQNYRNLFPKAIDLLRQGDLKRLDGLLEKALIFGSEDSGTRGMMYFKDVNARTERRKKPPEVLRSFIRGLDETLEGGGYGREELHLFAALPGIGKSFALLHMAKAAILQRKRVVFYTMEMSEDRMASRLDSSFSGVHIHELRNRRDYVSDRIAKVGSKFGDSLIIKGFPTGLTRVRDLRAHLHQLKLLGFQADVVLVDYINIMASSGSNGQRHRDLGQIYIDLRGMGQQFNTWMFTAAQSHRGGYDVALLTLKNLAESFEGAMHCDTIVTLNRSDEEARRETMRLYVAKDRNSIDKRIIAIHTNYARGLFYDRRADTEGTTE